MNWLDITLLCLAAIGCIKGLFDGVIKQVVSLIALVVGIFFCGEMATLLRGYLITLGWFPAESITIISYFLGFILIVGIVILAGIIMDHIVDVTPLGLLNHLAGGFVGIVMMLIFCSMGIRLINSIDKKSWLIKEETKHSSKLYTCVEEIFPTIYPHNLFTRK